LAVDADGWVCVGTLVNGAVSAVAPDGEALEQVCTDDPLTTNLCFGGSTSRAGVSDSSVAW
jgi:gluconolactonase